MKFKDFMDLLSEFKEEKESGKLYDSKGRHRANFDSNGSITLLTRYFFMSGIANYYVLDRETNEKLFQSIYKNTVMLELEKHFPNYRDPMAYWS